MRRLIFTDVHAVAPALCAILDDAGHWDEALFLGDIVGFGPHPRQCAELLRESGAIRVLGNHDTACCAKRSSWIWDAWTYDQLSDDMRRWIIDCKETISLNFGDTRVFACHRPSGAPRYITPSISPQEIADAFPNASADLFLCGHSHHGIERIVNDKRYVCIRSTGQMRDSDPRTGYTIEENGILTHYRIPYDVERVVFDLNNIGLEPEFQARWSEFIRTAYDKEWSRL